MEPKHQNLREIFMHPTYKSNFNTRSQHVYFSFIFSQEFPGGKCSPKIGSKPQKKAWFQQIRESKESPG